MKQFDLDTWEEILVTITRNKTRSLLTAFGIFWGIFMLISLLGGAKGMQETLSLQFKGFATNSGFMGTNQTSKAYRGFQQGRYWDLENKDVERILRNVEGADVVTPTLARWGVNIVYNEQKISGTLKGLYPIYSQIEEPLITQGRYLNDMDVRDNRKVCIIGKQIYESLFPGGENPCGKYIEINGIYYQVIGVNMGTGNVSIQGNTETSVIIPFSTMQNNYNFGQKVQMIAYTARKGYAISEVEKDIARICRNGKRQQAAMITTTDIVTILNTLSFIAYLLYQMPLPDMRLLMALALITRTKLMTDWASPTAVPMLKSACSRPTRHEHYTTSTRRRCPSSIIIAIWTRGRSRRTMPSRT